MDTFLKDLQSFAGLKDDMVDETKRARDWARLQAELKRSEEITNAFFAEWDKEAVAMRQRKLRRTHRFYRSLPK
jgi:hypothetical protein